jgi:phytanoyl-CoA hydroxylase
MLAESDLARFHDQGFLHLKGVLDVERDLGPVRRACREIVDERAEHLVRQKRLATTFEDLALPDRVARLLQAAPNLVPHRDLFQTRHPALFHFLFNARLLDTVEPLLGPEILCHPMQRLRVVVPGTQTVDWHQDAAVLWPEADGHLIVNTWVPLFDAGLEDGCVEVLPGSHQLGLLPHLCDPNAHVEPDHSPRGAPQPLPASQGDVILIHNLLVHRARRNVSSRVRFSLDLRWQHPLVPTGRPFLPALLARSRSHPSLIDRSYDRWKDRWDFAMRETTHVGSHRWSNRSPRLVSGGQRA